MVKDLRSYLVQLEQERPEDVLHIDQEISSKWELTALQVRLEKEGKYPVIISEHPTTAWGQKSRHRVITNLLASRLRCAEAIGVPSDRVAELYIQKSSQTRQPVVVSKKQAPVKEVILKGPEVDLQHFPIVWHHELDPDPYITAGFVSTSDPETGILNTAILRCQIKEKDRMGWMCQFFSHSMRNLTRWWQEGRDCPMAVWVGHHPGVYLGGTSYQSLGYPEDHYPYIAGLIQEDFPLVPTETFGEKLLVPAFAEVVIEGFSPKDVWEAEAPFGERPGYIGGQRPSPVMQVTAITHRRDAYWQDILVGHRDNFIAGGFAVESRAYERVKRLVPDLLNAHAPASAGCRDHLYLQVRKTRPGIGRQALIAAIAGGPKHCFVFDEDIDIFDERQVLWAIATRTQWDRDLIVIPDLQGTFLDPSLPTPHPLMTKAGLDCTRPAPLEPGLPQFFSPVSKVPDEVLGRIKPEDFVSPERLAQIRFEY